MATIVANNYDSIANSIHDDFFHHLFLLLRIIISDDWLTIADNQISYNAIAIHNIHRWTNNLWVL